MATYEQLATEALQKAGITDPITDVTELGGGEVNQTYKIETTRRQYILRITKDAWVPTLANEARALSLLHHTAIPSLIFYDQDSRLDGKPWILETLITGITPGRLIPSQFFSLGKLLAELHQQTHGPSGNNLREQFLGACKLFGDMEYLLNHPDPQLRSILVALFNQFDTLTASYAALSTCLIHSDVTHSNMLVEVDQVHLIDWEFSKFSDPMCEFSTIYYEDMDYNQGKWRIKIEPSEKAALFDGYSAGGGTIDEDRIAFWIRFDKTSAAVFLYWRLHESDRPTDAVQTTQYQKDYTNLITSLAA